MIKVNRVNLRFFDDGDKRLIAWASCVINDAIFLNNIAVRYSKSGRIFLTFPVKPSRNSHRYFYFNPITSEATEAIEDAILHQLKKDNR